MPIFALSPLKRTVRLLLLAPVLVAACRPASTTPMTPRAAHVDTVPGSGIVDGRVEIEPSGEKAVIQAIDRAQHDLFLSMYILTDRRIIRALDRAVAQGVRVWALLEPHPLGMGPQPQHVAQQLMAAGVYVRWSRRGFALTHAKYVVVDDRMAIISTANFSLSGFSRDRDFLFFDSDRADVHEISNLFRCDWNGTPVWLDRPNLVVAPDNARQKLESVIRRTTRSLDVYGEELADPRIESLFVQLHARGVRVRVMLPPGASPNDAAHLKRAGIPVREPTHPYIHAKYLGVDGLLAYVGSENFSTASLNRNRELGVLLRGRTARAIARRFDLDWRQARS